MVVQTKNSPTPEHPETNDNPEQSDSKSEAAANVLNLMKKRHKSSLKNGFDSLEILRLSIQSYFNKQVDILMNDFMEKFFQPAINNIKENTDEKIDEQQMKKICRNLLEDCAATQYSNEMALFPIKSIKLDKDLNDSETSESGTSLLQQALKRKRTEAETENLYKRQFFITTAPNTFNTPIISSTVTPKSSSSSSLLTSALTSPPKAMRHTGTRPIFHLIPANRNLKSTHVELLNLLKQNSSLPPIKTEPSKTSTTVAETSQN